ncbi:MAG: hypothetical protein R2852_02055 [Bacteroidia bacterium]
MKFSHGDLKERALWDKYHKSYEEMIQNTSTKHAPWHVVSADNQWVSRAIVGRLLYETLDSLKLHYPKLDNEELAGLIQAKVDLENE